MTDDNPLRDLPDEPPIFARQAPDEQPCAGQSAVIWWKGQNDWNTSYSPSCVPNLSKCHWLPASHCRIDGEPPEEVPEVGKEVAWDTLRGGPYKTTWTDDHEHGPGVTCWDYIDTADTEGDEDDHTPFPHPRELAGRVGALEEKADWLDDDMTVVSEALQEKVQALEERVDTLESDDPNDPHAHLPGDLRDPAEWRPQPGDPVIGWYLEDRPPQVGRYATVGEPSFEYYGGSTPWEDLIAARPATLRPEEE